MKCSVCGCRNNSSVSRGKSFFRFPSNSAVKDEWIRAIGRPDYVPGKNAVVCEDHFLPSRIVKIGVFNRLLSNTTPLVNIQNNEHQGESSRGVLFASPTADELLDNSGREAMVVAANKNTRHGVCENQDPLLFSCGIPSDSSSILLQEEENISRSYPSSASSKNTVKLMVDNMEQNLNLVECMETSSESTNEISERLLIKKAKLKKLRKCIAKRDKSIKRLNQKVFRQGKKILQIKAMLEELKARNLIDNDIENILMDIVGPTKDFLHRYLSKVRHRSTEKHYNENVRSFALNLNFLSPKAYSYVRDTFSNCLPHPRTLSEWYKVLDCSPGFTAESFNAIKMACDEAKKNNETLHINFVFDEINIRKHVDWDGEKSYGYVDTGDGGKSGFLASQILVFMAVCLNRSWKIPIGFFPIISLTGDQKSNIISIALAELKRCGADIIGVTFDGAATNISAIKSLGCDLKRVHVLSNTVIKVHEEEYIAHPDPCHMIKLIRNTLGDLKIVVNGSGDEINWAYLEKLVNLQEIEQLHLGNKLRQAHIYFAKKKMNVKLATQLLSESVADALDFCSEVLKLPDFQGSKPLSQFLRVINNSFDMLNSRKLSTPEPKKRALCENNANEIMRYAEFSIVYLSQLKLKTGQYIIESVRKMGFIGFIAGLKNLTYLYIKYIAPKKLLFIPMYKLNQDHLELFFSSIRMHLGRNNNPSVRQFIAAYKRLLVRCQIREGGVGNCIALDKITILNISKNSSMHNTITEINDSSEKSILVNKDEVIEDPDEYDHQFILENSYASHVNNLSDYVNHVVYYIAGFIVFKLSKQLICPECLAGLEGECTSLSLIGYKTKGYLKNPSNSVVKICEKVESILRLQLSLLETGNCLKKDIFLKIIVNVLDHFINKSLFEDQNDHMVSSGSHYSLLVKCIAKKYLNTRYFFLAKKISDKISLRQHWTKMVIFKGM